MNILSRDLWQFSGQRQIPEFAAKYSHILLFLVLSLAGILLTWLSGKSWMVGLPVFILGPLAGLFMLRDYRFGVFLVILLLPLNEYQEHGFGMYKFALQLMVLILWSAAKIINKENLLNCFQHPLIPVIGCLVVATGINALLSTEPKISGIFFLRLAGAGSLMFYFVFADLLKEKKNIYWMFIALFTGAAAEAVYAALDYFMTVSNSADIYYRACGTFIHSNIYARFMGMAFLAVTAFILSIKNTSQQWGLAVVAAIVMLGTILSFSRSVMLGIVIGMIFIVLAFKKEKWAGIFIRGLMILFIGYYIVFLSWLINETPKPTPIIGNQQLFSSALIPNDTFWHYSLFRNIDRKPYWTTAIELISEKPLLGHGLGRIHPISENTFNTNALDYMLEYARSRGRTDSMLMLHPHNSVLGITLDMGIVGLILFLWLYGRLLSGVLSRLRQSLSKEARLLSIIGGAALCYEFTVGLAEPAALLSLDQIGFLFVFVTSFIFVGELEGKKA